MCSFKIQKTSLVLATVFFLILSACAPDASTQDAASGADASLTFEDGASLGEKDGLRSGFNDINLLSQEGYVLIQAKTPDDKPADFYICSDGCENFENPTVVPKTKRMEKNVTNINFHTKAGYAGVWNPTFTVRVVRNNHMFVDQSVKVYADKNPSKVNTFTVDWTEKGSWGLAPNGLYNSSHSGKNEKVSTSVKNGKVTLTWFGDDAIVANDVLSPYSSDSYFQISGNISPDLSQIQVKIEAPVEPQKNFTSTLTLVK